jgi:hypothetical protein
MDEMDMTCSTYRKIRTAQKVLVRKLWRSRHIWQDNIKLDLREISCEDMDRVQLAQYLSVMTSFWDVIIFTLDKNRNSADWLSNC